MKLSVIIPVYNEQDTIAAVITAVSETPLEKEIIGANDESSDASAAAIESARSLVRHVHHAQQNAWKGTRPGRPPVPISALA